jgi:hypothetical protein
MRQGLCVRFALPEGEFCSWLYERSALPSTPKTSTLKKQAFRLQWFNSNRRICSNGCTGLSHLIVVQKRSKRGIQSRMEEDWVTFGAQEVNQALS